MGRKKKEVEAESSNVSKENKNVALALLESQRKALYAIRDFFNDASTKLAQIDDIEVQAKLAVAILNASKNIGPVIESLDSLEDKVKRDEKENISRRGEAETSLFEE